MLCIRRKNTNPYFNLATEEYVLKNIHEDSFMLWRNKPCVIVGKHQNTLAEINLDFIKSNNIPVVRRLSGGGAVFHDLGNLNFTFIKTGNAENLIDFRKYTEPIIEVLQKLDIQAKFEGRNDLTINGLKFSGNAEHIWKNRVLHHGTLLFSSDITDLSQALNADSLKFTDKAVKSVRSRVTNISDHLKEPMNVLDFYEMIINHIINSHKDIEIYELSEYDNQKINELVVNKYNTWDWNFGYSPKYNFSKKVKTSAGTLELNLNVENGIIKEIKIFGDFFNKLDIFDLENYFLNSQHDREFILQKLNSINIGDYINNYTNDDFISAII